MADKKLLTSGKREMTEYSDRWKMFCATSVHERVPAGYIRLAESARLYMDSTEYHDIKTLEIKIMDAYEEEVFISPNDLKNFNIRWGVVAKQHIPPFWERRSVAIYFRVNLLLAIFEPSDFKGLGAGYDYQRKQN